MLVAVGGLAACGPEAQDGALAESAAALAAPSQDRAQCRRWTTCVPENPCHTGWVTGCRGNVPVCTDIGGWLANGTSCGADAVCHFGECEPCKAGERCALPGEAAPGYQCRLGEVSCGTGEPICEDRGPAPDGSACMGGGPYVCKGGQCTSCFEGTACSLEDRPCREAVVKDCATTGGTCAETGSLRPDGSWCGYGSVCNAGECVECQQWAPCTPEDVCWESGFTECSSGSPRCIPTWTKPDGTECPGGTCRGGACVPPCVPDQPCTSGNACYTGRTVCEPWGSWCQDVAPVQDGTSCGENGVCLSGWCSPCGAGSYCQLVGDTCQGPGTVSCSTGKCEATSPTPDGWSCGPGGETCQAGVCTDDGDGRVVVRSAYWVADLTGTTWSRCEPDWAAGTSRRTTDTYAVGTITHSEESFAASLDCSGPVDAASSTSVVASVTTAGDRNVTWAGGMPPPNAPWYVTATALRVKGFDPVLGTLDFKFLAWVNDWTWPRQLFQGETDHDLGPDGYPTLLVPEAHPLQEVVACQAGVECAPPYSTCERFAIDCSGGVPACAPTGALLEDGTACGDGFACAAGACLPVPSRDVTGNALTTYWTDAGEVGPLPAGNPVSIAAVTFASPTAVGTRFAERHEDGSFVIRGVPEGPYLLELWVPWAVYVPTSSSTLDLGGDLLGRPDLAFASTPTPVRFDVKTVQPWAPFDVLEMASSNASVAAFPLGLPSASTANAGATQLVATLDWNRRSLVDGAAGDVAFVFHGSTTEDPLTGARVTAASGWAELPAEFALLDGVPATVDVTLQACPSSAAVTADWRRSAFEAYVPQVHPDAAPSNHRVVVSARPHASPFAPSFRSGNVAQFLGLPLLLVQATPFAGDAFLGGIQYGRFLPPLWREYRHDRLQVSVPFTAPGALEPARLHAPIGYDVAADAAPAVVAPVVSPPRDLRIGGADAWSGVVGVGTMPTVSWSAPELGTPSAYAITAYEVTLAPDGVGTRLVGLFDARTTDTSFRLPGTFMTPGGRYVVSVTAEVSAESLETPLRTSVERAYATVVSREFTP